jgi:anti-anti-sigma factor
MTCLDGVTVRLSGEHDLSTAPEVTDRINSALRTGARCVGIDLDQVTFLDAGFLGALVRGRNRCVAQGAQLVVSCSNDRLRRIFSLARLAHLLHDEP